MILDTLNVIDKYASLHPAFPAAFEFLRSIDPDGFTSGRRDIVDDRIFALGSVTAGVGVTGARLEAHRRYIDIQYSVAGIDNIGWRPLSKCIGQDTEYDPERDVVFYSDIPETWFGLSQGDCAIFFPDDAHAPFAVNGHLHKIVIKVLLNW